MSLRWFHYIFILFAIIGADLAGAMILRSVRETGSVLDFVAGLLTLVGGLGLAAYAIWLTRKFDRLHLS